MKNELFISFESFSSMRDNGNKLCYMLCKLLGLQIMEFVTKQSYCILLKKHEYKQAIRTYNVIIRYTKLFNYDSENQKKSVSGISKKGLYGYYLLRSQCYFKLGEYQLALYDAKESYKINKSFEKGYIMHAKILMTIYRYQLAKSMYVKGYAVNGTVNTKKNYKMDIHILAHNLYIYPCTQFVVIVFIVVIVIIFVID